MRSRTTVVGPQEVVIWGRTVNKNTPIVFAGVTVFTAIMATINLIVGLNLHCYGEYYCEYRRNANIIFGSCFVAISVGFLVAAITLHVKIRKATRLNQSNPPQQPVTVSHRYPGQPVIAFTTMSRQYPPPYSPPTGPAPYSVSSTANQYPPPLCFTANTQSMQPYPRAATPPPPYSP